MPPEHYFSAEPAANFKPRKIEVDLVGKRVSVTTAGSIFSPEHLDTGTAVLLEHLDENPEARNILDIGCGWGPISLALAMKNPSATVWAVDVNHRALELTELNARNLGLSNVRVATPEDVPAEIEFDEIWSNPPIRVGKHVLHSILKTWLPRLSMGADALLVVQKNLGADSLLRWLQDEFESHESSRVDTAKGFRVLKVIRKI